MAFAPTAWIFIYLLKLLLVSVALGSLTLHSPRQLMVPRLSRFLVGFCLTPFVLGIWMLGAALVLPGGPRGMFGGGPVVISLAILVIYGPRSLRRLSRSFRRTQKSFKFSWPVYGVYLGAALLMAAVGTKLVYNGQFPVGGSDALVYLGEALPFAQERSILATPYFHDELESATQGDIHNFLYPAFLSDALLTTGNNPIGYPFDHAARATFQMTIVYMLLAMVALARLAPYPGVAALALIFLLQAPQLEYISVASSRDAFRIIPLLLLAVVLSGLTPARLRGRLRISALLPPFIGAALALSGHTIGGVIALTLVGAWLIWGIFQKAHRWNLLLVVAAVGLGLFVSGLHYITAYLETGQLWGYRFAFHAMEGTALEKLWPQQDRVRLAGELTPLQRLSMLLERDRYVLSSTGLLSALLAVLLWKRFNRQRRARAIPFLGLMLLAISLPFLGVFDYKNYQLSQGFIWNFRYQLHWYPFAAVCLAGLVAYGYNFVATQQQRLQPIAGLTLVGITVVSSLLAYRIVSNEWRTTEWDDSQVSATIGPLQNVMQQLPAGKKLLLDYAAYNYYLDNQAIIVYSRPTAPLIQAKNESEVRAALAKLNIGAVALTREDITGWWDQIPLFDFLNNSETAFIPGDTGISQFQIYITEETLVRQQQQQAQIVVKHALEATRLRLRLETENRQTYLVANTGYKLAIDPANVTGGPGQGAPALLIDETTQLNGPVEGLDLSQGSLLIWARLTNLNKEYATLVRLNNNQDLWLYRYAYDQSQGGRIVIYYNGAQLGFSSFAISDDRWHHYVFTWQDGAQRFYIDGVETFSTQAVASPAPTEVFAIGWLGNQAGMAWEGPMANLITFNRPLSAGEVMALYQAGPLAGYNIP